uniref:Uncharacterized protein n=2 Tax=viral metagenome TaxID=1070528 RepID=A0A6M3M1R0_9ZZZZ
MRNSGWGYNMARPAGYTTMQLKKATLSLLNQMRAEEAGRVGESNLDQDQFLKFLLNLYQSVKGDTPVLTAVWKKTGR